MNLYLLDSIGPFFKDYRKKRINWSKIPFNHLEDGDRLNNDFITEICAEYEIIADRALAMGYNALTIDDLAHMVTWDFYHDSLKTKLEAYQALYSKLMLLCTVICEPSGKN